MKDKINWKKYFGRNKKSPLDIKVLFPGYFNMWIFRGVIIFMLVFTFFVYQSNDFNLRFKYVICPEDSRGPCEFYNNSEDLLAEPIIMQPGEIIGKAPNFWAKTYNKFSLLFVLIGFLINHLFYWRKTGNFKIPVNKEKWKKVKEAFKDED